MHGWWRYRRKLRRFESQYRRLSSERDRKVDEAKSKGENRVACGRIEDNYWHGGLHLLSEEIDILKSDWLTARLSEYDLPQPQNSKDPPQEDMWAYSPPFDRMHLTDAGRHAARRALRQEARERREVPMAYMLAAIALIGALTGLAAVLRDPPSAPSEASSAAAPDAPG